MSLRPSRVHFVFHSFRSLFFALVVCASAFVVWAVTEAPVAAQSILPLEPPPLVRMTGMLVPFSTSPHDRRSTLTVRIKDNRYILQIKTFEKLTGRGATELHLLQSLFPPFLRVEGPEPLLLSLQDSSAAGKPISLEGRLYTSDRLLFLTDFLAE